MVGTRKAHEHIFDALNVVFLFILGLSTLYPMLHVLFSSLSEPTELARHRGLMFLPRGLTLMGYKLVFQNPNIMVGYLNTIFYVTVGTTVNIFLTAFGAYVLSRKKLLLRNALMFMVVFTMFFSGGLIPLYLVVMKLGLLDTRWAIIFPTAILTWNLIVMRTSFATIPDSLEESARIDGAHDFTILFRIILPVSKAVLAVMILFYAVGRWNSWFEAAIYLQDRELYPLQLILREILIQNDMNGMKQATGVTQRHETLYRALVQYATIIVATVPILAIYPFLQKHFVKGVMIGSLKG